MWFVAHNCSASGPTHTESGKLYRKVKHRARPKVTSRHRPKRAPTKRRSPRPLRRRAPHTEHGLGVLSRAHTQNALLRRCTLRDFCPLGGLLGAAGNVFVFSLCSASLHVEYAERGREYGILFIFSLVCEYIHLEHVRIHAICRDNQAGYGIHIIVVAPQEYVNIYSTRRSASLEKSLHIIKQTQIEDPADTGGGRVPLSRFGLYTILPLPIVYIEKKNRAVGGKSYIAQYCLQNTKSGGGL